jgi:hypothetical protein
MGGGAELSAGEANPAGAAGAVASAAVAEKPSPVSQTGATVRTGVGARPAPSTEAAKPGRTATPGTPARPAEATAAGGTATPDTPAQAVDATTPGRTAVPAEPAGAAIPERAASDTAAQAVDATPAAGTVVGPPEAPGQPAVAETETEPTTGTPLPLWQRVRADPLYAPELIALAVVQQWGPQVAREAEWLRATYPAATPAALARYAQQRQVRRAGYAGLFATATGVLAPVTQLAGVLAAQARLVLGTAAAFGRDPAHPDRAAELLALVGAQPTLADAQAAVAAAQAGPDGRDTATAASLWRWAGLAGTGRFAALPLRLFRGADLLAAVLLSTSSAERVARRATSFYR